MLIQQLCPRVCSKAHQNTWKISWFEWWWVSSSLTWCCWNRWVLAIFKPSLFFAVLFSCKPDISVCSPQMKLLQQFRWQSKRFQEVKVLCLSPSGDGGPALLWLRILPFCQYLVFTLLVCWNITLLRKSKHLLFPHFNIGLRENGCDYCFIPSAWNAS